MDYRKKFIVKPGSNVDLSAIDPDYTGDFEGKGGKGKAKKLLKANGERLSEQQVKLYAGGELSAMLVAQAPDTGGKDGLIEKVFGVFNPQGSTTTSFKTPSPLELSHHFIWRAEVSEPRKGQIAIFNRSHYEDVLIVRVRNLVPEKRWKSHFREYFEEQFNNKKLSKAAEAVSFKSLIDEFGLRDRDAVEKAYEQPSVLKLRGLLADKGLKLEDVIESGVKAFWKIRFEEINDYERSRARNGMQILKFYLHIDKEEQLKRIWDRVNKPEKNWKVSEADFTERKLWKAYRKAYEEMLSATSTKHAPWFILPANHKWFSRLAASEIVAGHFESLGMKYPEPTVDIEQIKREYFGIKAPGDKPRFDLA